MAFLQKTLFLHALKVSRNIHTSAATQSALRKWVWTSGGFHKYGLRVDDLLDGDHDEDVKEALRRLPQHLIDERNYRHIRAIQCNIEKSILPKEQWTKYEEDKPYLQELLKEVIAERKERETWESTH